MTCPCQAENDIDNMLRRRLFHRRLLGSSRWDHCGAFENRVAIFKNGPTAEWYNTIYAKGPFQRRTLWPWENTEAFIEGIRETFRLANTSKHQK
jgi:hypothetical protein